MIKLAARHNRTLDYWRVFTPKSGRRGGILSNQDRKKKRSTKHDANGETKTMWTHLTADHLCEKYTQIGQRLARFPGSRHPYFTYPPAPFDLSASHDVCTAIQKQQKPLLLQRQPQHTFQREVLSTTAAQPAGDNEVGGEQPSAHSAAPSKESSTFTTHWYRLLQSIRHPRGESRG